MLVKIIIALVLAIAAVLIYAALQPPGFRIAREIKIAAPAPLLFAKVNDLRKFQDWNPWAKMDPNAKSTFSGPAAGVGAINDWSSADHRAGSGRMTVVESVPNSLVRMRLDFKSPMTGTSVAEFSFRPDGKEVVVTWAMTGDRPYTHRLIGVFMSMDKMVGGVFEKGLADLKAQSEAPAKP